ncbi:MAG: amidohydrolase family protein [Armatimonadota bacterium]
MINDTRLAEEFVAHGRVDDCPVIDTHAHFGPYQAIYFPRWRPERVLHTMDACNVRWLIMSGHTALVDTQRGNREIAEVVAAHADRIRGYWVINPNYPGRMERELEDFEAAEGFVGFKFHPGGHGVPLTDDRYRPALEYADARGLPVLSHTWAGKGMCSYAEVAQVAERHPNVRFLMGHAGYGDWIDSARVARDHEHVYLELTAAYSVRGALEIMIEHAGSEKILFGTDHPWFDPRYGIGCILSAYMTDEDRRNILYRNAQRLFGLPLD